MVLSNGLESFVNLGSRILHVPQPRPSFECVKAEPAFVAQPTLVHFDVAPADCAIDLAGGCRISRNAAANGSGGVIDTQVAAGAASAANGIRSLQKPDSDFESEIRARERANRTHIDDIHRVGIIQRTVFEDADLRVMPAIEYLNLVGLGHVAGVATASRAQDAALLIQLY